MTNAATKKKNGLTTLRTLSLAALLLAFALPTSSRAQGVLLWSFDGEESGARFGQSLAGIADVDGDTIPDVVVGAPGHDGPAGVNSGRVYVLSGASGTLILVVDGAHAGGRFGAFVAALGDVDDDNVPDFLVGAPANGPTGGIGRAYAISGGTGDTIYSFAANTADTGFGRVAGIGDVNTDGAPDFVIGEPYLCLSPSCDCPLPPCPLNGAAYVYSGSDGALLYDLAGPDLGTDHLGLEVAGAGDFDGDSWPDILLTSGTVEGGRVNVLAGPDGDLVATLNGGQFFGLHVAPVGDLNVDTFDDVLVSGGFGAGVFAGPMGAPIQLIQTPFTFVEDVAGSPDINADGVSDYLIAAGPAYVHSGLTGAQLYVIPSNSGGFESIDSVGDLDGDGVSEVAIGADTFPGPGGAGRVFVYSLKGACTDLDGDGWGTPLLPECGFAGDGDCDDFEPSVNPGAAEACNGVDDDCDGVPDDPWTDADGDGWGAPCDCDDGNALVNPDREEVPGNGLDDDCDPGTLDCPDADGDGFSPAGGVCGPADCRDLDPNVNPGEAETPGNGLDDDCNPATPDCPDADGDGYSTGGGVCGAVDCDDSRIGVNPGAVEIPGNGLDDNCNGVVDLCGALAEPRAAPANVALFAAAAFVLFLVARRRKTRDR